MFVRAAISHLSDPGETGMRLWIVQHGDALAKAVDPARPLSEKGRSDVERLASHLAVCGVRVERVVHSGKTRAQQTAEILAAALQARERVEVVQNLDPLDPPGPFAAECAGDSGDLLVAGHMPFVGRLISLLLADREEATLLEFVPGTAACLERADDGAWSLVCLLRPEFLSGNRCS
jgi:phosphohistidine phosphatase